MMRNLKALGLALAAVFAMSVFAVQAASAEEEQGHLTSTGPVTLEGTDTEGEPSALHAFGQTVTCHGDYHGGKVDETPHGFFEPPVTEVTLTPTYTNCKAAGFDATVTMNSCDYVLKIGKTIEEDKYGGTVDLECEGEDEVEIHLYFDAAHELPFCTIRIPEQTGLTGGSVSNVTTSEPHTLTLSGPVEGIEATREGAACGGHAETTEGVETVHAIIQGTNEAEEETDITITDTRA